MQCYLVQSALSWEDIPANLAHFEQLLTQASPSAGSVVILPEMFSTGFSMASAKLAEPMHGSAVTWMRDAAARLGITLTGSLIIEDSGNYYNRMIWTNGADLTSYDKRHLFRMAGEHNYYSMGEQQVVVDEGGTSVCLQICYDLRFPVWARNNPGANAGYDVLIYVANWPAARSEQWLALLKARAIENQSYVIGVNRIGVDGNDVAYQGDSVVLDYAGNTVLHLEDRAVVENVVLDMPAMQAFRESFPAYLDADSFEIRLNLNDGD